MVEHLLERYGTLTVHLLAMIAADPTLATPLAGAPEYLAAEVAYAAQAEGALHLDDVLTRRTRISIETPHRGTEIGRHAAAVMGEALGWDEAVRDREVEHYLARVDGGAAVAEDARRPDRRRGPDRRARRARASPPTGGSDWSPSRSGSLILVDEPRWPARGRLWSHLVSDLSYAELHVFAEMLGRAAAGLRPRPLRHPGVPVPQRGVAGRDPAAVPRAGRPAAGGRPAPAQTPAPLADDLEALSSRSRLARARSSQAARSGVEAVDRRQLEQRLEHLGPAGPEVVVGHVRVLAADRPRCTPRTARSSPARTARSASQSSSPSGSPAPVACPAVSPTRRATSAATSAGRAQRGQQARGELGAVPLVRVAQRPRVVDRVVHPGRQPHPLRVRGQAGMPIDHVEYGGQVRDRVVVPLRLGPAPEQVAAGRLEVGVAGRRAGRPRGRARNWSTSDVTTRHPGTRHR